jgi:hypothetical protein
MLAHAAFDTSGKSAATGNRLFGMAAEIMWLPNPAYLLMLRTPLYFVRN